jgi:DNA-dependent RNA polymerase auxiliary subunit epsilon
MAESIFTIHAQTPEQESALKAFVKAMKMRFEVSKEKPYNTEFVEKIAQGDKDYEAGKGRKVSMQELNNLWK